MALAKKTTRSTRAPQRAAARPAPRPTTRATTSPARGGQGMDPALFAELLESVREGGRILRGEAPEARTARRTSADELRAGTPRTAPRRKAAAPAAPQGETLDVSALRERFGLSQAKFAALLGISARTLQGWEQGRREPQGAERTLLRVAARHPDALLDVAR